MKLLKLITIIMLSGAFVVSCYKNESKRLIRDDNDNTKVNDDDSDDNIKVHDDSGYETDDDDSVVCVPDCSGKDCGDDGCGGSCGICSAGRECQAGICKPTVTGEHIWSKRFGSTSGYFNCDEGHSVSVDSKGNVFMTGSFGDTVDFGGSPLKSTDDSSIFLAKYDTDSNHLFSKKFSSLNGGGIGYSVSVDSKDNVFVTGFFGGTVDFGGGPLTCAGDADIFLIKYGF